jgi:hypothetical protein
VENKTKFRVLENAGNFLASFQLLLFKKDFAVWGNFIVKRQGGLQNLTF